MKPTRLSPESEIVPRDFIQALCHVKKALAQANADAGALDREKAQAIHEACDALCAGKVDADTRISLWASANGEETHRILSELLARRASDRLGKALVAKGLIHPVDELSLGQSPREAYATAMNVAAALAMNHGVIPAVQALRNALEGKAFEFSRHEKWARELNAHVAQLDQSLTHQHFGLPHLYDLPVSEPTARELARLTGLPFVGAHHPGEVLVSSDGIVHMHGALKGLAATLLRVARELGTSLTGGTPELSGLVVPHDDLAPFDSLRMACAQILGNDVTIGLASALGRETGRSPFLPVMIHSFLQSTRLITERLPVATTRLIARIRENRATQRVPAKTPSTPSPDVTRRRGPPSPPAS